MPEEYTDAGVWPANGYLYRGLKRVERHLLRVSDAFVLLTEKAREIVFPGCTDADGAGRPIEVIPLLRRLCQISVSRRQLQGNSPRQTQLDRPPGNYLRGLLWRRE